MLEEVFILFLSKEPSDVREELQVTDFHSEKGTIELGCEEQIKG